MAEVERRLLASPGFTAKKRLRPIPPLRPAWVEAADDGSAEFRLALALASQAGSAKGEDPVRAHWMPLDPKGGFATDAGGLRNDPRVVCDGLDAERDLIALVRRRLIEGQGSGGSRLPLVCPDSRSARLPDLAALAQGSVDLDLVCDLARPFMALRRGPLPSAGRSPSSAGLEVDDLYALFRIAYLPFALPHGSGEVSVPADPAIFARLAAGDVAGAGTLAIRRLTASGLPPRLRRVAGDRTYALRLAASLAFPVSPAVAGRLACRILHNPEENTDGR